jgi:hypothetical protein
MEGHRVPLGFVSLPNREARHSAEHELLQHSPRSKIGQFKQRKELKEGSQLRGMAHARTPEAPKTSRSAKSTSQGCWFSLMITKLSLPSLLMRSRQVPSQARALCYCFIVCYYLILLSYRYIQGIYWNPDSYILLVTSLLT